MTEQQYLNRLVGLLCALNIFQTDFERKNLCVRAFYGNTRLLGKIDYSGSSIQFLTNLIVILREYGEAESGVQALWQFLLTIKDELGPDHHKEINVFESWANKGRSALAQMPDSSVIKLPTNVTPDYLKILSWIMREDQQDLDDLAEEVGITTDVLDYYIQAVEKKLSSIRKNRKFLGQSLIAVNANKEASFSLRISQKYSFDATKNIHPTIEQVDLFRPVSSYEYGVRSIDINIIQNIVAFPNLSSKLSVSDADLFRLVSLYQPRTQSLNINITQNILVLPDPLANSLFNGPDSGPVINADILSIRDKTIPHSLLDNGNERLIEGYTLLSDNVESNDVSETENQEDTDSNSQDV